MKKILIGTLVFVFSTTMLFSQDFGKMVYVSLDMNKPLSNTQWVEDFSARGAMLGYRKFISDKFSAGVDFNWSMYDQYQPRTTFETSSGAITTDYFKYVETMGVAVSGQYYLKGTSGRFLPYAGLGLGASLNTYSMYYNIYSDAQNAWGFLVRPEVGVLIPFSEKIGATVGVHYSYATNKMEDLNYNNFSTIGVKIGLAFFSY